MWVSAQTTKLMGMDRRRRAHPKSAELFQVITFLTAFW